MHAHLGQAREDVQKNIIAGKKVNYYIITCAENTLININLAMKDARHILTCYRATEC